MRLDTIHSLIIVAMVALATQITRWTPFLLFSGDKKLPKVPSQRKQRRMRTRKIGRSKAKKQTNLFPPKTAPQLLMPLKIQLHQKLPPMRSPWR